MGVNVRRHCTAPIGVWACALHVPISGDSGPSFPRPFFHLDGFLAIMIPQLCKSYANNSSKRLTVVCLARHHLACLSQPAASLLLHGQCAPGFMDSWP